MMVAKVKGTVSVTAAARLKVEVMMVAKIKGTVSDSVSKVVGRGNNGSIYIWRCDSDSGSKVEAMMVAKVKGTVSVTVLAKL